MIPSGSNNGFLDGLEASGLLAKTVIAATGDHPNRAVFNYSDSSQLHLRHGVPIWFYIPEAYRQAKADDISLEQWASHEDIFPTLRSEEHTSELQSRGHLVCRLVLEDLTVP